MKVKVIVAALFLSMMVFPFTACAGDWYAALEKDIVASVKIEDAVAKAKEMGAAENEIYDAVLTIAELHDLKLDASSQCRVCAHSSCCDASSSRPCPAGLAKHCDKYDCCQ